MPDVPVFSHFLGACRKLGRTDACQGACRRFRRIPGPVQLDERLGIRLGKSGCSSTEICAVWIGHVQYKIAFAAGSQSTYQQGSPEGVRSGAQIDIPGHRGTIDKISMAGVEGGVGERKRLVHVWHGVCHGARMVASLGSVSAWRIGIYPVLTCPSSQ